MKRYIPFLVVLLVAGCSLIADSFNGGGGSGSGTTVTVATPYITVGSTKYVAATMWPFTAFFSGSFLDANTCTLTAGTNGSENVSCNLSSTSSWYSTTATTSIEAEFSAVVSNNNLSGSPTAGIWICDSTNGKVYDLEAETTAGNVNNAQQFIQLSTWTLASCAGTPSAPSVSGSFPWIGSGNGLVHLKLAKVGGNIISSISQDGGQTYTQLNSTAVGTIAKAGISVRAGSATTNVSATFLSVVIN